ncbi:cell division protein FtsZ [Blastococcus aurantiacus]|uniref:Cell division protein FtsZ n=1 Tax=Blastococcus aurantiacus TaxID=1550231 RepID=A0A1G7JWX3_9ACTN|nr:antitoxin Xre/MbcA/ParS toxin-binding domain-containing protein [Blastococcus aurantiacus]SDF29315.1 cell division protein FtsZ [Blastococcus aurantiacus]
MRNIDPPPSIVIIGVGPSGTAAIDSMQLYGLQGVEFASFGDGPGLTASRVLVSAGALYGAEDTEDATRAEWASEEIRKVVADQAKIIGDRLSGTSVAFITHGKDSVGLKGASLLAEIATSLGILTIGVSSQRGRSAHSSLSAMQEDDLTDFSAKVNTLMLVSPDAAKPNSERDLTVMDVLDPVESSILTAVQGVAALFTTPGLINLDLDDLRSVLATGGRSMVSEGYATGDDRALRAAEMALNAPYSDDTIAGARRLLLSIQGPSDLGLFEINEAASLVADAAHDDATIIFGAVIDDTASGEVHVIVLASELDESARRISISGATQESRTVETSPADYKRVMRALHRVWAPGIAEDWLKSPNSYLSGARPMDALREGDVQDVIRAIAAEEAGSFS